MARTGEVCRQSVPCNPLSSPYDAMLDSSLSQATDAVVFARSPADLEQAGQRRPVAPPGQWSRHRRPLRPSDQQLNHEATEWVLQLPVSLRPANTCSRYPRIVNRIVQSWLRADQCRFLFDQLLRDGRPARRGFPLSVREELQALAAFRLDGILPVVAD
jgi:hypothetical protein